MAGWQLSGQARQTLRTARDLARGRRASGSADPLLAAILGQWDDERAGGPALLRACGLTAGQAGQIADTLLPDPDAAPDAEPGAEPRVIGGLRFVLDQAELGSLSATEQAEAIDPLEELEVPTPAAAMLGELARQQAHQHPVEGDGRVTTLHHLLALLMWPRSAARRLLTELGLDYEEVVQRIEQEGARRVAVEEWRREELPVEGWEEFRVTDRQDEAIRRRFHAVNRRLGRRGVRFMLGGDPDDPGWALVRIHPGGSGLAPRAVLDRLLGHASRPAPI